jgi:hypothetical protein
VFKAMPVPAWLFVAIRACKGLRAYQELVLIYKTFNKGGNKMMRLLSKECAVKVDGKWRTAKAIAVSVVGGWMTVYLDRDGCEIKRERFCRSQFKETKLKKGDQ